MYRIINNSASHGPILLKFGRLVHYGSRGFEMEPVNNWRQGRPRVTVASLSVVNVTLSGVLVQYDHGSQSTRDRRIDTSPPMFGLVGTPINMSPTKME